MIKLIETTFLTIKLHDGIQPDQVKELTGVTYGKVYEAEISPDNFLMCFTADNGTTAYVIPARAGVQCSWLFDQKSGLAIGEWVEVDENGDS